MNYLLKDVQALERMLDEGMFEEDPIRIGAEQELCIVDSQWKPAGKNLAILETADNDNFTTELAKFNLEINLSPCTFEKNCLSSLEKTLNSELKELQNAARAHQTEIILTGILPTLRKYDMDFENLTPLDRYKALMLSLNKMRGRDLELKLRGVDELILKHDSPILEACNTSFQVHLQTKPGDFVQWYNISQAIAGPVIAIATNSPMLFGKRLWHETRLALFQQSVDTRHASKHLRDRLPRVTFGNRWLQGSILDIYREDISRFRVILSTDDFEDANEILDKGGIPKLRALQVHNGTVYRWNRPCYGIGNGKPHLRIENRILPSGPTVVDEIANAAFWLGLMIGMADEYPDITRSMDFDNAKNNLVVAARHGIETSFRWVDDKKYPAQELIKKELVPLARAGLKKRNVDKADIDRYMDIIEARNTSGQTGSTWALESYSKLHREGGTKEELMTALTAATFKNQQAQKPVHKWKLATFKELELWDPAQMLVEEFMTTDLFTVQKEDILQLALDLMDWQKIRYLPVEDNKGQLVGLITSRNLLKYFGKHRAPEKGKQETVKKLMVESPVTITPEATIIDAMQMMQQNRIGCLPVVKDNQLIGIVTEQDFLKISARLISRYTK